jgi:heme/copper-type cytochrome/quinol oxidase subunit 4
MDKRPGYAWTAMAVLVLASVAELYRLVANRPWAGFPAFNSHAVSFILTLLFAGAAVAIALRARWRIRALTTLIMFAAPVAMIVHGVIVRRLGENPLGLVYIPVALLLMFLLRRLLRGSGWYEPEPHSLDWGSSSQARTASNTAGAAAAARRNGR